MKTLKTVLIWSMFLPVVLSVGCYTKEQRQRDDAVKIARAAIESEKITANQRNRAIEEAKYWKQQAEKCYK